MWRAASGKRIAVQSARPSAPSVHPDSAYRAFRQAYRINNVQKRLYVVPVSLNRLAFAIKASRREYLRPQFKDLDEFRFVPGQSDIIGHRLGDRG